MKLTIFKAGDGDCFLIDDGTAHVLVDGGRMGSYTDHVSERLNQLHKDGHKLDRVCISHIDDDHISGVLRLLDDKVDWKVHRHQRDTLNNTTHTAPDALEPPEVVGRVRAIKGGAGANQFAAMAIHRYAVDHLDEHVRKFEVKIPGPSVYFKPGNFLQITLNNLDSGDKVEEQLPNSRF